ncbi:PREDICTED: uncharacterized protein LOC107348078 [Acropora digitifera]|uniref:uncharacterized protein LOC107348078 n=1 Tax=Acropora digitifera TaxID=70779 RepID=UPI00077A288C|nr:PREDICTED: uncharacterized protein LOC107348078 [Acropora digitifera]
MSDTKYCIIEGEFLGTISSNVKSSTNFALGHQDNIRSSTMIANNKGPSFVPWGIPPFRQRGVEMEVSIDTNWIDETAATANVKKVSSSKKPLPASMAPVKAPSGQTEKDCLALHKTQQICPKESLSRQEIVIAKAGRKEHLQLILRGPPSAKSLVRPSVSKGAAKVYLGTVIQRNAEGKQSITDCKKQGSFGGSSTRKATTSYAGTSEYLDVHASNMKSTDPEPVELNESINSSNSTQPSALAVMDKKQGKSPESVSEHVKRESRSNSWRTNLQVDKQEMFDPFTEGSELKLPVKYRRLKAASAKLYSELKKIADNRETSLACQQFLHKVESVFDMENIPT